MGTCMSSQTKSQRKSQKQQIQSKRELEQNAQVGKQTCDRNSPQSQRSDRLAEVKLKLPPLQKGIQKRQKIISMISNSSGNSGGLRKSDQKSFNKQSIKNNESKTQPNEMSQVLKCRLNKEIPNVKSQIFNETVKQWQNEQNKQNEDNKENMNNKDYNKKDYKQKYNKQLKDKQNKQNLKEIKQKDDKENKKFKQTKYFRMY